MNMMSLNRWLLLLVIIAFSVLTLSKATHGATDRIQDEDAEITAALTEINDRFDNTDVQLIHWLDDLQKQLGQLKPIAFMAYPENKPSGKLPLLITLHGAGGKQMSLTKQLVRSSQVKGFALTELAGKNLILLEPNSADSWDPNSLDRMLDYVLDTYDEIDKSRIYVMGHSMGGAGTWNWIRQSADRFAAAASCGFSTATDKEGIEKLLSDMEDEQKLIFKDPVTKFCEIYTDISTFLLKIDFLSITCLARMIF